MVIARCDFVVFTQEKMYNDITEIGLCFFKLDNILPILIQTAS
jgi:hypothetical protein